MAAEWADTDMKIYRARGNAAAQPEETVRVALREYVLPPEPVMEATRSIKSVAEATRPRERKVLYSLYAGVIAVVVILFTALLAMSCEYYQVRDQRIRTQNAVCNMNHSMVWEETLQRIEGIEQR